MFISELGDRWHGARTDPAIIHLDSASAGRSSNATIEAITEHLWRESRRGSYVALDDVANELQDGRNALGALLGSRGDRIVFRDSARASLRSLLSGWNLPIATTVWVAHNEFGPNLIEFERRGFAVRTLPDADVYGHVDVDAVENMLQFEQPDFIHICQIGSGRGVVQPVAKLVDVAHNANVPIVVDMAQAVGHVPTDTGADIVYGTSRKWLAGPRGVGFVAVQEKSRIPIALEDLEVGTSAGYIAGRLGLGRAVAELTTMGVSKVHAELAKIGATTRERLHGIGSWEVVEPLDEPSALVTLAPPPGWLAADIDSAAAHLRSTGVLVTAAHAERAPLAMENSVLRLSPHLDVTREQLDRVANELRTMGY